MGEMALENPLPKVEDGNMGIDLEEDNLNEPQLQKIDSE